jgi:hypothetical protein
MASLGHVRIDSTTVLSLGAFIKYLKLPEHKPCDTLTVNLITEMLLSG